MNRLKFLLPVGMILMLAAACNSNSSSPTPYGGRSANTTPQTGQAPASTDQSMANKNDSSMPTPTAATGSTATTPPATKPVGGGTLPPTPAPVSISIANFAFNPATITIPKGARVTWANNDNTTHTVTGNNGGPASGNIATGQSYSYTFNQIGTYSYHCSIHPNMVAKIIVQ